MTAGIYAIVSPSGKCYIGSAVDVAQRRREHLSTLRRRIHKNSYLQRAADKYGVEALQFEVLEVCGESELFEREQCHIDAADWQNLYNLAPVAGGLRGYVFTPEQRAYQSKNSKRFGQIAAIANCSANASPHVGPTSNNVMRRRCVWHKFGPTLHGGWRTVIWRRPKARAFATLAGSKVYLSSSLETSGAQKLPCAEFGTYSDALNLRS